MQGAFILDKRGVAVEEPDTIKWGTWFEKNSKKRQIASTFVKNRRVSTVFLGLDYSFSKSDKPHLFETMVFDKKETTTRVLGKDMTYHESFDEFTCRYSTTAEAKAGHKAIVAKVKATI